MRLKDRVAIVTGAARGIGRGIALTLARAGANVVVADILDEEANKVAREINDIGTESIPVHVDVSKRDDVQNLAATTIGKLGRVDILVNNAGVISSTPFEELSIEEWHRIMAINLDSVLMCSQEVARHMKKQLYGKIVSVSSIAGEEGGRFSGPAYAVSKAGIICLTKCMARALAKYNITVNAIAPGVIDNGMTGRWSEQEKQENLQIIPLGRFGTPQDVANLVVFLSSAQSDYITGHTINVDGGKVM